MSSLVKAAEKLPLARVVIIGSGAAGVGAARWLLDNDLKELLEVIVVEARDRVGGRVHTDATKFGVPIDCGAAWLHDHNPENPMSIMAERLGLSLRNTMWDNSIPLDMAGNRLSDNEVDRQWDTLERAFVQSVKTRQSRPSSESLEKMIKDIVGPDVWNIPAFQSWCSDYDFEFGTSLKNVSPAAVNGAWMDATEQGEEEFNMSFPATGYGAIIDGIINGSAVDNKHMSPNQSSIRAEMKATGKAPREMHIELHQRVVCVDTSGQAANACEASSACRVHVVDTRTGIERNIPCAAVICTVPIGVLKAESILFRPPLSAPKLDAIHRIGCGNAVKVVMEFETVFWPSSSEFVHIADSALCEPFDMPQRVSDSSTADAELQTRGLLTHFWNFFKISGRKILVGFALGDAAHMVDRMSDDEVELLIVERMKSLSVGRASAKTKLKPVRWLRTSWGVDPLTLCSYSFLPVGEGNGDIFDEMARAESDDCLWLAGEACQSSAELRACVGGAWLSGVRAAEEVTRALKKEKVPGLEVITPGARSFAYTSDF